MFVCYARDEERNQEDHIGGGMKQVTRASNFNIKIKMQGRYPQGNFIDK